MLQQHVLYLYAMCVGIAVSGFVGSLYALMMGDRPEFRDLLESDFMTPIRVPAVVLHMPIIILCEGALWMILQPIIGIFILAAGLGWSFLQGVFILTQVFGLR
jgi:hypothetical protein